MLSSPVVVSVPHAGRDYPDIVFAMLRVPKAALVRLEDRYADLLVRGLARSGQPVIIANRARAWIDLNRDERDLDVEMVAGADKADYLQPGTKQRGGLGLVPRRLSGVGELWRHPFELSEIEQRVVGYHRPYHAQLAELLRHVHARFGIAVLLDLHSMPPLAPTGMNKAPQFVVGDRFGQSAGSHFAELLIEQIRLRGFAAAVNHPYAGDHILRHHGQPRRNIHAIQLEVDRSLYLDSALREPGAGLHAISMLISDLVFAMVSMALGHPDAIAAE